MCIAPVAATLFLQLKDNIPQSIWAQEVGCHSNPRMQGNRLAELNSLTQQVYNNQVSSAQILYKGKGLISNIIYSIVSTRKLRNLSDSHASDRCSIIISIISVIINVYFH